MQKPTTTFILSDCIIADLSNGQYERIGGVIRNATNKRVVLWLRESFFTAI
jgi:putative cell wall-binding protein